jgi:hypothetical protein
MVWNYTNLSITCDLVRSLENHKELLSCGIPIIHSAIKTTTLHAYRKQKDTSVDVRIHGIHKVLRNSPGFPYIFLANIFQDP